MTRRLVTGELELRGERGLRTIPQRREHLPGLAVVVIDRLLAEDDQQRLLPLDELEQDAAATVSGSMAASALHVQRAVRAHRERGAQLLLAVRGADGGDDHFVGAAALLDAQCFLERDLVEGIDAHLDAIVTTPVPSGFTRMRTL